MDEMKTLLQIGGVLHFGILIASFLVPRVLNWRVTLKPLPLLVRQLIWVHGAYIVLTIVGLGCVSLLMADELASGAGLGRAVCAFVAVFWGLRVALQVVYFESGEYLTNWFLKAGHHALTAVFTYLTFVYTLAASGVMA